MSELASLLCASTAYNYKIKQIYSLHDGTFYCQFNPLLTVTGSEIGTVVL